MSTHRTAVGPDMPDMPDIPIAPADPFGTQIEIAIPDSAYERAKQVRWLLQEATRAVEANNYWRLEALLRWGIRENGVALLLERQLATVEAQMTGREP